jgi:hypothetical protein
MRSCPPCCPCTSWQGDIDYFVEAMQYNPDGAGWPYPCPLGERR